MFRVTDDAPFIVTTLEAKIPPPYEEALLLTEDESFKITFPYFCKMPPAS